MRRLLAGLLVCATLIAPTGAMLLAHEGHDHKVMGTVTSTAANHIVVKDKDGKSVTIQVTPETRIKATPALKLVPSPQMFTISPFSNCSLLCVPLRQLTNGTTRRRMGYASRKPIISAVA